MKKAYFYRKSDNWVPLSLTHSLTDDWLTQLRLEDLIEVALACEDSNSFMEFGQYFAADVLVWSIFWNLSLVDMLMFGRDFEIDA